MTAAAAQLPRERRSTPGHTPEHDAIDMPPLTDPPHPPPHPHPHPHKPTAMATSSSHTDSHHGSHRRTNPHVQWRRLLGQISRLRVRQVALLLGAFLLGFYGQLLGFYLHVRWGFTGEILSTQELPLHAKHAHALELVDHTRRVTFVSRKTNWDFVGLTASPHTVLFAHEDVVVPAALSNTLSVVRHTGVDSYLNLHNKTLTIMAHVHAHDPSAHFYKQDDEAVVYWPHYYQCLRQCHSLANCYAGDMHVNIGDVSNSNSYVFATGGSYFVGRDLLQCLLEHPVYVRVDGLDHGEDKTVGKMLHYNHCDVQYVSCKWFNNEEVFTPTTLVRMTKGAQARYIYEDTELLSEAQQVAKQPQNPTKAAT